MLCCHIERSIDRSSRSPLRWKRVVVILSGASARFPPRLYGRADAQSNGSAVFGALRARDRLHAKCHLTIGNLGEQSGWLYCDNRGPVGGVGAPSFSVASEEGGSAASALVEGCAGIPALAEACAVESGRIDGRVMENSGIAESGMENAGVEGSGIGFVVIENSAIDASGMVDVGMENAGIFDCGIGELGMENAGMDVVGVAETQSAGTSIPLESGSLYSDGLIDDGVRKLPLFAEGVAAAGCVRPDASPKS